MTWVLLDTNAYLRLAKRIKPLLGVQFGRKDYQIIILKDVENEVHRNSTLSYKFPWFEGEFFASERMAKSVRITAEQKVQLQAATSVLYGWVLGDAANYTTRGRSPPSPIDCRMLAFGQIRPAIVVTDDLGMHKLAKDFEITVWHGHELLKKMLAAKIIHADLVRDIFKALETNNDLPISWKDARHTTFRKIFGAHPQDRST